MSMTEIPPRRSAESSSHHSRPSPRFASPKNCRKQRSYYSTAWWQFSGLHPFLIRLDHDCDLYRLAARLEIAEQAAVIIQIDFSHSHVKIVALEFRARNAFLEVVRRLFVICGAVAQPTITNATIAVKSALQMNRFIEITSLPVG